MDPKSLTNEHAKELLDAQAHIWNHIFNFLNSMALKCAIELGIPDVIHKHGQPITLFELARVLSIPVPKSEFLNRLMRLLVHSKFFSKKESAELGEFVFDLTINSQLLLKDHPLTQAPFAHAMLAQTLVDPAHNFSTWIKSDISQSPFHIANGMSVWEHAGCMAKFNEYFNQAMCSDSRFIARLMLTSEANLGLFVGVESLVDVGGGNGTMAKAIGEVYPNLKCVVLDLPHVVEELQGNINGANLEYVGGDMFAAIPSAQLVLLKSILHDWSDEHCIKILENCKKAIPSKEKGGRVMIIDSVVVEDQNDDTYSYTRILFDLEMMSLTIGGKERTEQQWKKLFLDSGFDSNYKTLALLGIRSVIEIYPL